MGNQVKSSFLSVLKTKFGTIRKISSSQSLFDIGDGLFKIYIRYSKIHKNKSSFYGLRREDLKQLEGFNSYICFLWEKQKEPLFIPYSEYEEVFNTLSPASDGQYKIYIYHKKDGTELHIANAGKFTVEPFVGWSYFEEQIDTSKLVNIPTLEHSQVQTIIGYIGILKGYDVWIPFNDRSKLDWNLTSSYECSSIIPNRYKNINNIIREVDVIWIQRGSSEIRALFEVEHSTPIYSGLLRLNDLYLIEPKINPNYNIVSNYLRKSAFLRQINRPTFTHSGLSKICNFLEYKDLYYWFDRIKRIKI